MSTIHTPFLERDSEELLTLSEVAEILKVPVNTPQGGEPKTTEKYEAVYRDRAGNRHRRLFVLKKTPRDGSTSTQ